MPAQQGLGAYQERPPGRATENPAQGGEDQATGRLEAAPANLAFKHAELVAERENLDMQRRVCIPAEDDSVEQGT